MYRCLPNLNPNPNPNVMNLIQYFGEDCMALVVILGVGMNLVPILATRKARIGTLFLSDLAHIMAFLSDDWAGRCLEWIQIQSKCGDVAFELRVPRYPKSREEPRYPTSREDVRALSALSLSECHLITGEFTIGVN